LIINDSSSQLIIKGGSLPVDKPCSAMTQIRASALLLDTVSNAGQIHG
jgi:hypothetical protein